MKRLIAAVSFSLLAAPALAEVGLPYDQNLVDRTLPDLQVERTQVADAARVGNSRSDAEISTDEARSEAPIGSGLATGPWANDYHFIAPAQ